MAKLQKTPQLIGLWFIQAYKLRMCVGFIFAGLAVAAHTAQAEEGSFSHDMNIVVASPKSFAPAGAKFGNTPQLPHAAGTKALDKTPPQLRSYAPPDRKAKRHALSFSESGEMLLSNKNPKAAAMSLKEAIMAMNASSDNYNRKFAQ